MTFRTVRLRPSKSPVHSVLPRRASLIETLETRRMLSAVVKEAAAAPASGHGMMCGCPNCSGGLAAQLNIDNGGMTPGGRGQGGGDYQIGGRWNSTATNPSTGSTGNPITLTWGLVADGLSIPGYNGEATSNSNLIASLNSAFVSQATWLPLFQQVFDTWSANTGVTYVYQATDDNVAFGSASGQLGVRADIRIGGHNVDGGFNVLAYNFYPGEQNGGDMVIDTSELLPGGALRSLGNNKRAFRNTIAHEHGHGLGLAHVLPNAGSSGGNTKLMEPNLSTAFDGPQFDDILAVQSLYGDPFEKGGRNEFGATATNVGTLSIGTSTLASNVSVFSNDVDNFKLTIDSDRELSLTATPVGPTYLSGPQSGPAPTSFNASAQADLTLRIYQSNGTTLITSVNATGLGAAETISNLTLPAGTYVVRVSGAGSAQMYTLSATSANLVTVPPDTPSAPDLSATSDSGDSNSDDITNDTTPTFSGTTSALTTITLKANDIVIGSTLSSVAGAWSITPSALADGVYAVTAVASNNAGTSEASAAVNVTIDTQAPTVVVAFDREVTQNITLTFSDPVASKLMPNELTVVNQTTPGALLTSTLTTAGAVVTIDYNGLFADGRYKLSVLNNAVSDVAGNNTPAFTYTFVYVVGDADNDGTVGFQDLVVLSQNYGLTGKTFSQGNFNYDTGGNVDFNDLVLLAQQYNVSIPPLAVTPPPSALTLTGVGSKTKTTGKKPSGDVLA